MVLPPAACYPPPNTKLPTHLIMEFWYKVHDTLVNQYGLTPSDAATAMIRFRADTDQPVEDMRYHSETQEVAETIATAWHNGSLQPQAGQAASVTP